MFLECAESVWRAAVLAAQLLVVMVLATGTLRRRQFVTGSPGKQPGLHIFVADVVAGLDLTIGLAELREQPHLIRDVGINGVGDQKIRATSGSLGQTSETFLGLRF